MATATTDTKPKFDVNAAKEKAMGFAKARPAATAALAGVLGIALINTLRGR
jgi:hypothetical protein